MDTSLQHRSSDLINSEPMLSSYDQVVASLIVKSRIAGGLPPLDNEELAIHVRAWSEILYDAIPQVRLDDAYRRAMQENEDGFALTASKMIAGFKHLCESERVAPQIPQNAKLLNGDVCPKCHGSGMEIIVDQDDDRYKVAMRCDHVVAEDPDDVSMF